MRMEKFGERFLGRFGMVLILPLLSVTALKHGIKVKAVPPVYNVEVKGVTLYEATIPIFFHVQLPRIPDEFPAQNKFNMSYKNSCSGGGESNVTAEYRHYHCALERQFILASKHIVKDLQMQREQFFSKHDQTSFEKKDSLTEQFRKIPPTTTTTARKKRQAAPVLAAASLLAGFLLRPAVSKFTGNLFGSNEEWASHFNAVRESLIKEHELLLDFEQSTQAYTQEMADIISTMSGLLTEQKLESIWSLRLLSTKMHADLIQAAVQSCKTKHLPGNLIQPNYLQQTLSRLDKNLTVSLNYTLAISTTDNELGKYYKLPIADCLFTEDKVHVTLNVPLRRKNVEWKLHEIVHTKFAFQNQICEVYPQEAAYLAEEVGEGSRSVLITNHMLRYCSVYEDKLCMVPRYGQHSVQSLKCTSLAARLKTEPTTFKQGDDEALLKSCSFRCYHSDEVIITQVDDRLIVVTNADNVTYECADNAGETTIQVDKLGAIEIKLECDCSIKINEIEMPSKPLPCAYTPNASSPTAQNIFTYTMPFVWAHNLSRILEEWDGMEPPVVVSDQKTLGAHVNHEWFRLVPVLNFTKSQQDKVLNFTIPEIATDAHHASFSLEIWLGLISVVVLLHLGLTMYCSLKLFMIRMGEYELPPASRRRERIENDDRRWFFIRERPSSSSIGSRKHYHKQTFLNSNCCSINKINHSSNETSNGRHDFEEENRGPNEKLNESKRGTAVEGNMKSHEDSYHSNRNSAINKLI